MPRSLGDLWGRLRRGLRAAGRRRAFLHTLSRAGTERDPARRVALADILPVEREILVEVLALSGHGRGVEGRHPQRPSIRR